MLNEVRTLRDEVHIVNETVNRTDIRVAFLENLQCKFTNLDSYLRWQVSSTNTNTRIATNNVTSICESTHNIVQDHMKE